MCRESGEEPRVKRKGKGGFILGRGLRREGEGDVSMFWGHRR